MYSLENFTYWTNLKSQEENNLRSPLKNIQL